MKKYDNFCKSLENLKTISEVSEPCNLVEKTGVVGLLKICFSESWRLMKNILRKNGAVFSKETALPENVIKMAYSVGLIRDEKGWEDLLKMKNSLTNTDSDEVFIQAVKKIESEYINLFEQLKQEVRKNWM